MTAPDVECEKQKAALAVSDVAVAVTFYTEKLGFRPGFDSLHADPWLRPSALLQDLAPAADRGRVAGASEAKP